MSNLLQVLAYGGYLEFSIQFRTLPGYEKFTLTDESVPLVVIKVCMFRQDPTFGAERVMGTKHVY